MITPHNLDARYVANALCDPRLRYAADVLVCHDGTEEDKQRQFQKYLSSIKGLEIGPPMAVLGESVEQLTAQGIVGLYRKIQLAPWVASEVRRNPPSSSSILGTPAEGRRVADRRDPLPRPEKQPEPPEGKVPLRVQDWEHRIGILQAWRHWKNYDEHDQEKCRASFCADFGPHTYRAVLDGCAITIRALLGVYGITCNFRGAPRDAVEAFNEKRKWFYQYWPMLHSLSPAQKMSLFEVIYLSNRPVAHPGDGTGLDHKVGKSEMTGAIDAILFWLAQSEQAQDQPGLDQLLQTKPKYFSDVNLKKAQAENTVKAQQEIPL